MRRGDLHSSHLVELHRLLRAHGIEGLESQRRGSTAKLKPNAREFQLEREKRQLEKRLAKAEAVIGFQKSARAAGDPAEEPRARRGRSMQAVTDARGVLSCAQAFNALSVPRASYYRAQARASSKTKGS